MKTSLVLAVLAPIAVIWATALPAHANVVPLQGAELIADWTDATVIAPTRPTMNALHDNIEACRDDGCPGAVALSADDIERVAWWVARGNRLAIRLSFAAAGTIDGGSDGARILAQSYGAIIKRDPAGFLAIASDEGAPARLVTADATATSDLIADDYTAQTRELSARRAALQRVVDPALADLRDQCIAGITARMAALAPLVGGPVDEGVDHPRKAAL